MSLATKHIFAFAAKYWGRVLTLSFILFVTLAFYWVFYLPALGMRGQTITFSGCAWDETGTKSKEYDFEMTFSRDGRTAKLDFQGHQETLLFSDTPEDRIGEFWVGPRFTFVYDPEVTLYENANQYDFKDKGILLGPAC